MVAHPPHGSASERRAAADKRSGAWLTRIPRTARRNTSPEQGGSDRGSGSSARRCWAKRHAPKPEGVFHDARRSACASAASVWGSQHVLSQMTCTPTVRGPLGWTVACTTRPGQRVRPAAPPRAPDQSPRLVPGLPLANPATTSWLFRAFGDASCTGILREGPRVTQWNMTLS